MLSAPTVGFRRMTLRLSTASLPLLFALQLAAQPPQGMVFIPGGEYTRGRTYKLPDDGAKWFPELLKDDGPAKMLKISPFYLDEKEATIAQYADFVTRTKHRPPYNWPGGKPDPTKLTFPVAAISWDDAAAYCKWIGKRLPTEAEWERAARGAIEDAEYPWGNRKPTNKDARFDTVEGPGPVATFAPNGFGLYDIAGNVWEWTSDWYAKDYYAISPADDPKGPDSGQYKVLRGGSWADVSKYLRVANRTWARPAERGPNIGVRCAADFPRR